MLSISACASGHVTEQGPSSPWSGWVLGRQDQSFPLVPTLVDTQQRPPGSTPPLLAWPGPTPCTLGPSSAAGATQAVRMAAAAAYVAGILMQACLLSLQPATRGLGTVQSSTWDRWPPKKYGLAQRMGTPARQAVQAYAAWQAGRPTCSRQQGGFWACSSPHLNGEKLYVVIRRTYPMEPPAHIQ